MVNVKNIFGKNTTKMRKWMFLKTMILELVKNVNHVF